MVGSLNMDVTVEVTHHPRPGETVLGGDGFRNPGGKGANQAVGAARLGRRVAMIGRTGDDADGRVVRAALESENIDARAVHATGSAPTGMAMISVDGAGENSIVVSPGANARLTPADVERHEELIASVTAVLLQLEVPLETVEATARLARGTVCLNPAPWAELPTELLAAVDVLTPNRSELAGLTGGEEARTTDEAIEQAAPLAQSALVVVTLGAGGALVVEGSSASLLPAFEVDAVDTTAAGDSFCAALADALIRGEEPKDAARWAQAAAAVTVTRAGAQGSLPTAGEVRDALRAAPG